MKLLHLFTVCSFLLLGVAAQANPVKEKFTQAMQAFQAKDFEHSVVLFEETIKLYPLAQAYNFMAMAKKELGVANEEVIALLQKAVELDPKLALAYDNLGKMYYGDGEFDKAKENALKAVELDPHSVTARLSLAWIHLIGFGESREAIEHFEEAIKLQKTDYAMFGLGMAYFMDNQRGRVLEMITQLKMEGNLSLANDLEDAIREGRYLPAQGISSLAAQREEAKKAAEELPAKAPIPNIQFPVRLSAPLDAPDPYAAHQPFPGSAYPPQDPANERIQQLQRNYR